MASDHHRLPTLVALEQELRARARAEAQSPPRPLGGLRPALIVAFVAAVLAIALTPLGGAIAQAIGDLIGIGDEPSREVDQPSDEPAVVIGLGETPAGQPFEIVASSNPAFGRQIGRALCVSLDFPASGNAVEQAHCISRELSRRLARRGLVASAARGEGALGGYTIVSGFARAAAVEVTVQGSGTGVVPADLFPLRKDLAEEIRSREFAFFFAFLPHMVQEAQLRVSASEGPDKTIGQVGVDLLRLPP